MSKHKIENFDTKEGGIDWENDNLEGLTIYNSERGFAELDIGDLFIHNDMVLEKTEDGFIRRAETREYTPTGTNESTILEEPDYVLKILKIVDYDKELIVYDFLTNK